MRMIAPMLLALSALAFACVGTVPARADQPKVEIATTAAAFPEGTIFVGDTLYFVDYTGNAVLRLSGGKAETVWKQEGCGQSGLVQVPEGLLVTCYDNNTLALISLDGKLLATIDKDAAGQPLAGPNDLTSDGNGGVYFTASGPWDPALIVGKLYRRDAEGTVREVANDLHYPNGVAVSGDGKRLYVAETYAWRVISFAIGADGALSDRRVFALLSDVLAGNGARKYGPDAVRVDKAGNVFVGLYEGGGFAVLSPDAKLLAQVDLPAPHDPNLAITPDGKSIYVTGVFDMPNNAYRGELYKVPNPVAR